MFITDRHRDRSNQYICFFCIHVRTAVISIGTLKIALLCCAMLAQTQYEAISIVPGQASNGTYNPQNSKLQDHKFTSLLFVISMFSINLMLLIGAVQYKQAYLMPFFCVQVIQFSVNCLNTMSLIFYEPNIKHWIDNGHYALQSKAHNILSSMDNQTLKMIVLIFLITDLAIQGYLIDVVLRCYKFFVYKSESLIGQISEAAGNNDICNPDGDECLPPNYVMLNASMPPKYEDVVCVEIPATVQIQPSTPPPPPPSYAEREPMWTPPQGHTENAHPEIYRGSC